MMKKLLFSVFLLAAMLSGCEKIGTPELEGTIWRAETEEFSYILLFENESTCKLAKSGLDITQWIEETAYTWRYILPHESMFGEFLLETDEGIYAAGAVENKTLYLSIYSSIGEPIKFKKIN